MILITAERHRLVNRCTLQQKTTRIVCDARKASHENIRYQEIMRGLAIRHKGSLHYYLNTLQVEDQMSSSQMEPIYSYRLYV